MFNNLKIEKMTTTEKRLKAENEAKKVIITIICLFVIAATFAGLFAPITLL